jgi:hypothetical protein
MRISPKIWPYVCGSLVLATCLALVYQSSSADSVSKSGPTTAANQQVTEAQLGSLLSELGLQPKQVKKRYDFTFKARQDGNEWDLTMSAVLSRDGQYIWVMAWLDPLPKNPGDVPKMAMLRLLANNDRLGKGQFFAYVSGNRRIVLQRVVENRGITQAKFREIVTDLSISVIQTYPYWSVENWKQTPASAPQTPASTKKTNPKSK